MAGTFKIIENKLFWKMGLTVTIYRAEVGRRLGCLLSLWGLGGLVWDVNTWAAFWTFSPGYSNSQLKIINQQKEEECMVQSWKQ